MFGNAPVELGGVHHVGVDLPPNLRLGCAQRGNYLWEADVPHHEQIHVAALGQLAARSGPEDERKPDPLGEGLQRARDGRVDRYGLLHEPAQFPKDG
jgi:hypothetical protein